MNSIKVTTHPRSLYSSIRLSNMCKNLSYVLFTSQNTSIRRQVFTLTNTHNKVVLSNNKSIFLSSHSNTINHKRYFNNFFSLKFWSTKKSHKPVSSNSQKFFDTSTTSNLSINAFPTSNLATPTPTTESTSTSTSTPTSTSPIIYPPHPPISRNKLILNYGGSGIPKNSEQLIPTKNDEKFNSIGCGEDSFFLRHDSLGVADGVGGWRSFASLSNSAVDSALYARKLMHYSYAELEKCDNVDVNPIDILQKSYEQTIKKLKGVVGSSTALIAVLRDDKLKIANIGDCGIGVIHKNDFKFRSEEQQHSFNYPYQLGTGSLNTPKNDCIPIQPVNVEQGDIIIMGSDGLFDNLFDSEIIDVVDEFRDKEINPQKISDALAWKAKQVSVDLDISSPFQTHALQEGLPYAGGKRDDISVLVAVVTCSN